MPQPSGIVLWQSPRATRLQSLVACSSSFVVVGSVFWLLPLYYYVYRRRCKKRWQKALVILSAALIIFYPHGAWKRFRNSRLWDSWLTSLRVKVVSERPKERAAGHRRKLVALSPHGIFPFTVALPLLGKLNETVFDGVSPVVAGVVLRVPILRQVVRWLGAVEATPQKMRAALEGERNLAVLPGGIGEMFKDPGRGREAALLRSRKGFVRVALQAGADIVPVYAFGASRLLRRVPLPSLFERLSRALRMSLILFWGRWGLPIPFPVPITFAVGRTIEVGGPHEHPSDELVDRVHRLYVDAIERLFETYKHEYGWGSRTLRVL